MWRNRVADYIGGLTLGALLSFIWFSAHNPVSVPLTNEQEKLLARGIHSVVVSSLNFSGATLSETEKRTLASFSDLRTLTLSDSNFQDDDIRLLEPLALLEALYLDGTAISDKGLVHLKKLRSLRCVSLAKTKITSAGIRDLHNTMPAMFTNLYGANAQFAGNCVFASQGRFVLIRNGKDRVALKFTEFTNKQEGGAKYLWYWQPDENAKFLTPPLKDGSGEVFEKYRRTTSHGKTYLENDGGELHLDCGPIELQWSKAAVIYFTYEEPPTLRIALTPWTRVEEVDFDSPLLVWHLRESF